MSSSGSSSSCMSSAAIRDDVKHRNRVEEWQNDCADDLVLAVRSARTLSDMLREIDCVNVRDRLTDAIQKVSYYLEQDATNACYYVASERNRVVHDSTANDTLTDVDQFQKAFHKAKREIQKRIDIQYRIKIRNKNSNSKINDSNNASAAQQPPPAPPPPASPWSSTILPDEGTGGAWSLPPPPSPWEEEKKETTTTTGGGGGAWSVEDTLAAGYEMDNKNRDKEEQEEEEEADTSIVRRKLDDSLTAAEPATTAVPPQQAHLKNNSSGSGGSPTIGGTKSSLANWTRTITEISNKDDDFAAVKTINGGKNVHSTPTHNTFLPLASKNKTTPSSSSNGEVNDYETRSSSTIGTQPDESIDSNVDADDIDGSEEALEQQPHSTTKRISGGSDKNEEEEKEGGDKEGAEAEEEFTANDDPASQQEAVGAKKKKRKRKKKNNKKGTTGVGQQSQEEKQKEKNDAAAAAVVVEQEVDEWKDESLQPNKQGYFKFPRYVKGMKQFYDGYYKPAIDNLTEFCVSNGVDMDNPYLDDIDQNQCTHHSNNKNQDEVKGGAGTGTGEDPTPKKTNETNNDVSENNNNGDNGKDNGDGDGDGDNAGAGAAVDAVDGTEGAAVETHQQQWQQPRQQNGIDYISIAIGTIELSKSRPRELIETYNYYNDVLNNSDMDYKHRGRVLKYSLQNHTKMDLYYHFQEFVTKIWFEEHCYCTVWFMYGQLCSNLSEKIEVNSAVLEKDPEHVQALYHRGYAFMGKKDFITAKHDLMKLVRHYENIPDEKMTGKEKKHNKNTIDLLQQCEREMHPHKKKGHLKDQEVDDIMNMFDLKDGNNKNGGSDDGNASSDNDVANNNNNGGSNNTEETNVEQQQHGENNNMNNVHHNQNNNSNRRKKGKSKKKRK